MRSIHDKPSCKDAAIRLGKTMNNFWIRSLDFGARKPKGCSWHNAGTVEFWQLSSGDCDKGYHGCFCLNIQGKELITLPFHCNTYKDIHKFSICYEILILKGDIDDDETTTRINSPTTLSTTTATTSAPGIF